MSSRYPKKPYEVGASASVTMTNRSKDKVLPVRHNTPGNIILVHGVNDTGTGYAAVERGLCEGLSVRLNGDLRPGSYRLPTEEDLKHVVADPDAVFYKRTISTETLSPVIPFYWGYREVSDRVQLNAKLSRGQALDRYGNRLDADFSKGGGPFANATSTLPDMWNKGKWGVFGFLNKAQKDATHPVLDNPGRMYMILAARRLAALICMIRDYDENEAVSIVAHSQGCLISLLAQAFLLDPRMKEEQANARPADTLIMTHPPYSLIANFPRTVGLVEGHSDGDAMMANHYKAINGTQTVFARLQTLANIAQGVWSSRHTAPPLAELSDTRKHCGAVGKGWNSKDDRDNRGKTYLYFCPEDMTVALANVQGIGWQGIPDIQRAPARNNGAEVRYRPLELMGEGFRQRVFTAKRRPDPRSGKPVLVGSAETPNLFVLRQPGESDQSHTAVSDDWKSDHFVRGHLPQVEGQKLTVDLEDNLARGICRITGEALNVPVEASLNEGALPDSKGRIGANERVDPKEAAIAITSEFGIVNVWQCVEYPVTLKDVTGGDTIFSPIRTLYDGPVSEMKGWQEKVKAFFNKGKQPSGCCDVLMVYACVVHGYGIEPSSPSKILVLRTETPDEGRLRWQQQVMPRSFHGAIFGGQANHRNVTAYDVALGGGKASSDPAFYQYLCDVADWRILQVKKGQKRQGILLWDIFVRNNGSFIFVEPEWRKSIIQGNSEYYSTGILPDNLPLIPSGLPEAVISELK